MSELGFDFARDEPAGRVGVLAGIARHARPRAAMEVLDRAAVTLAGGIAGDFRGGMRGGPYKRQVTLMERAGWEVALGELGQAVAWEQRRVNLLTDGLDLPRAPGVRLHIGAQVVLEVTRECDPCDKMERVAAGLFAALLPDWRGGACAKVVAEGAIGVGDAIRIEEQ